MAKKRKEIPKDVTFGMKTTKRQHELIKKEADRRGQTMTDFVWNAVLSSLEDTNMFADPYWYEEGYL